MGKEATSFSDKIRNFNNPCGAGCSICCAIFSTWGVIMLIGIGLALDDNYRGIDGDVPTVGFPEQHKQAAVQTYIAAGIYAFFVAISVLRLIHLKFTKPAPSLDVYAN